MAIQIAGPVRMPDGTIPAHGRVIFTARAPILGGTLVTTGPVVAQIDGAGDIDITLQAEASGTPYGVTVEYWSDVEGRLIAAALPDIVPSVGAGPVTIADLTAEVIIGALDAHRIKRGSTLDLPCRFVDQHIRLLPLTDLTVTSALRGPDGVTRALTVTVSDPDGSDFEVSMSHIQTALLPLGTHGWDIKFSTGARVLRSITGQIIIEQEVTP